MKSSIFDPHKESPNSKHIPSPQPSPEATAVPAEVAPEDPEAAPVEEAPEEEQIPNLLNVKAWGMGHEDFSANPQLQKHG